MNLKSQLFLVNMTRESINYKIDGIYNWDPFKHPNNVLHYKKLVEFRLCNYTLLEI